RPIFFTGESHAGHYIPSMIHYILKKNADLLAGSAGTGTGTSCGPYVLNVEGAAIGNGWTDPWNQYDVSEFAFGMGLVSEGQMRTLKAREEDCHSKIAHG
ncbi:unnamed protein product, partial [Phaeothamnion confervicola]